MSQRGRKQPTTSQNQGYNQHQNVPPQPYCPANPGMMPPVQQCKYFFYMTSLNVMGSHGRVHIVVGFTTTYAISAYHC